MFYGLIVLIVVQVVNFIGCQRIPKIPCPNIFEYDYDGYKWTAIITVPTPDVNKVVMTVNFTVGEIGFNSNGKLELNDKDNAIKNIENYRPFVYTVTLPRTRNSIPQVTGITYNGNVMCIGPGLDPPSTSFWLSHTLDWYSSAITFPRKPPNSWQQPNNNYPQYSNNNNYNYNNYPQQPNNNYPQQPNNNYPQQPNNNYPQQPNNNYPQQPNNNYPQQPNNNYPQQPNNNYPQEPIHIPINPVIPPISQPPTTNNVIPKPPTKPKKNKYKNFQTCGIIRNKRNADEPDVVPFIYNGTVIPRNNHPWLTALYDIDTGAFNFFCGGNLISNKHVLTAAHCTLNKKNIQVKVGAHNARERFDVGSILMDVMKITNHEDYVPGSAHADISLIVMKENIDFIATIKPICLWSEEDDLNAVVGRTGTIMGWGLTETGDQSSSAPLQTNIEIASQQQCRSIDILKNSISDMTFCAGTKGKGPCMGDSGGGLFLKRRGRWYLRGIISVSIANRRLNVCDVNTYAVYVDTAKFVDWIVDNMN